MKRILPGLTLCILLAYSGSARALLEDSKIQSVIRVDADTCAIELENLGNPLDIGLLDQVGVGNTVLSNLLGLTDLLGGILEQVDQVLLATESFAALTGVDPDIVLENEDCLKLQAGATVDLKNALGVVDSLQLPGNFGDLTAIVRNVTGLLELVDLNDGETPVGNSGGGETPVGGGEGGVGGEDGGDDGAVGELPGSGAAGGCSQTGRSATPGAGTFAAMACVLAPFGALTARRRARQSR